MLENLAIERSQRSREALGPSTDSLSPREFQEAVQALRKGRTAKPTKLGEDLDEFILAIDEAHRNRFGDSFSERLLAMFCLAQPSLQLPEDWAFEEKAIAFLRKQLGGEEGIAQSILDILALTREGATHEKAAPFYFRRKFRLMRRPLPKLAVGNRFVYFLSNAFIGRSAINLVAEYMNGSHPELEGTPIKKIVEQLNQRNANYFVRERVAKPLRDKGSVVATHIKRIGKWDLVALGIGEIDILALKPGSHKLIVGEAKFSALHDVHVRQMRRDLTDYIEEHKGYADKLRRKAEWVTEHTSEVLDYIKVQESPDRIECVPVFFTNLYSPASAFVTDITFVREYDLAGWCNRI